MTLDIAMPEGGANPPRGTCFMVCAPGGVEIEAEIESYGIGGRVETVADRVSTSGLTRGLDPAKALKVKPQGYVRYWPIYKLELMRSFWTPRKRADSAGDEPFMARIRLSWTPPAESPEPPSAEGPMARVARLLVVNPDDLARWGDPAPPLAEDIAVEPSDPRKDAPGAKVWARLGVSEDGVVRLSPETLKAAGLSVQDWAGLRVFSLGEPVPVHVADASRNEPAGGYFLAAAADSPYTRERTYWITYDPSAPAAPFAAAPLGADPASTRTLERIRRTARFHGDEVIDIKQDNFLSILGVHWTSEAIEPEAPLAMGFATPAPAASETDAQFELELSILGDPAAWKPVTLRVMQEGRELGTVEVRNARNPNFSIALKKFRIGDSATTLTLAMEDGAASSDDETPMGAPTIHVTKASFEYESLARLGGPLMIVEPGALGAEAGAFRIAAKTLAPGGTPLAALAVRDGSGEIVWLAPGEKFLGGYAQGAWRTWFVDLAAAPAPELTPAVWPGEILAREPRADYLVIAHPDFMGELGALVELNRERGLVTRIVSIEDVYTFFGEGMFTPEAIRNYVGWALLDPATAPEYILLVGDANSDYLNDIRTEVPNYVPSYTVEMNNNFWASDYWFSLVLGDDSLPDAMLGRMSVTSPEDLHEILRKTGEYARNARPGPWRARMVSVADNNEDFAESCEDATQAATPAAFDVERIYLDELAFEDNWYIPMSYVEMVWAMERSWMKVSREGTARIKGAFDRGAAMIEYWGHGSPNIWADERIWFGGGSPNRDSQHLEPNPGRWPFIINYTCNAGAVDYPMPPWNVCISEDMMREPERGAVAMFAPTGPGSTGEHEEFAKRVRIGLFEDNERNIGSITALAHARQALSKGMQSLTMMYLTLGDPALDLHLTPRWTKLAAEPSAVKPGGAFKVLASELTPQSGKALVWLENEKGKALGDQHEIAFSGGKLEAGLTAPEDAAALTNLRVAAYIWNDEEALDCTAAGEVAVISPAVTIVSATAAHENGRPVFTIELNNGDEVDSDEFNLRVLNLSAPGWPLAAQAAVAVEAKSKRTLTLEGAPCEAPGAPVFYKAMMSGPLPGDLTLPAEPSEIFTLAPAGEWLGLAAPLCKRTGQSRSRRIEAVALAWGPEAPENVHWRLTLPDAEPTTSSMVWTGADGLWTARTSLSGEAGVLETIEAASDGEIRVIDSTKIKDIAIESPRVRIAPGSIHHWPEHPVDGETIYVGFEVENAGTALGHRTMKAELYGTEGDGKDKKLPSQNDHPQPRIGKLGAGRRSECVLRWDPMKNAGLQTVRIDIGRGKSRSTETLADETAQYQIYVKSKYDLARGEIGSRRSKEDKAGGRYTLFAEVLNRGEADAHNVEVKFFDGAEQTPGHMLGAVLIPVIPGKGKTRAEFLWRPDSAQYDEAALTTLRPTVQVGLKGSKQRFND